VVEGWKLRLRRRGGGCFYRVCRIPKPGCDVERGFDCALADAALQASRSEKWELRGRVKLA
jgi:hypothetical protein